ncbi:olfactory receptor 6E1-like [Chelonoidis abingdonii]|uniref:olfactory receptor 6E1-like n=1 Tax=Chelonoidis abingdonii TaxID=106734 RepID=UPI0013F2879A|nr:olfactory receptor 49-like [Chelonoidis abingdonii]
MENRTAVVEFILLGFTNDRRLQLLIFVVLLVAYLFTIAGNILIVSITLVDRRLQSPMYYFLQNFSLLEISFTSVIIPKALANMALGGQTISLTGCFAQSFLYFILGTTEFLLLAAMSFDRYVAICNPLQYTAIMSGQVCTLLALGSWIGGILIIIAPTIVLFQLPFCGPNVINHFFCDSTPLIKLACADTRLIECISFITALLSLLGTLAITLVSYIKIISTVMHFPSAQGRQKAFSTCTSHIIVVSITYGSCIFMYVTPMWSGGLDLSKTVAVLNTVMSPLLNPFIYSLRNRQVQEAVRKAIGQSAVFCKDPSI